MWALATPQPFKWGALWIKHPQTQTSLRQGALLTAVRAMCLLIGLHMHVSVVKKEEGGGASVCQGMLIYF